MRRVAVFVVLSLALVACDPGSDEPRRSLSPADHVYRDQAGWTAEVPVGWRVVPFETTKGDALSVGTQISNVDLPAPSIEPGLPIQTSGLDLPPTGLSLIIATDVDPANVQLSPASPASPPLSVGDFMEGSSTGDSPTISLLWFNVSGHTLLASIKAGVSVSRQDAAAMEALVASIRASTLVRKHLSALRTRDATPSTMHARFQPLAINEVWRLRAPAQCAPGRSGKRVFPTELTRSSRCGAAVDRAGAGAS